jgi:hypothetical protein
MFPYDPGARVKSLTVLLDPPSVILSVVALLVQPVIPEHPVLIFWAVVITAGLVG